MRYNLGRQIFLFGLVLLIENSFSQVRTLGTWKMFLPYVNSYGVCDAGDRVYDAASKSIFSYEKSTGVIQTYDEASGLSDIGVSSISYDPTTKFLAIAYNNSNLDFIYNGTDIYNINDIKKQATTGAVAIYSISFLNGNAYVSSDLGISVVDLTKIQISSTYVIGANGNQLSVYATTFDSANIYAATPVGVKYASRTAANLQDFNSWLSFGAAQNLPAKRATFIQAFNNKVYAVIPSGNGSDTLYQYNGSNWSPVFFAAADTFTSLKLSNGSLYFTTWDSPSGSKGYLGKIDASGTLTYNQTQSHFRPVGWFESDNVSWEADFYNGLFKHSGSNYDNIVPSGPQSASAFELNSKNGVLDVAPGGVDDSWAGTGNIDGIFIYKNGTWRCRNQFSDAVLSNIYDILCTASVPATGKTYFGSLESGLIEQDDNSGNLTLYNSTSAGLLESAIGIGRTEVTCLYADSSNNLWIGNGGGGGEPTSRIGTRPFT